MNPGHVVQKPCTLPLGICATHSLLVPMKYSYKESMFSGVVVNLGGKNKNKESVSHFFTFLHTTWMTRCYDIMIFTMYCMKKNLGLRPGPTQISLYSHRSRLEA